MNDTIKNAVENAKKEQSNIILNDTVDATHDSHYTIKCGVKYTTHTIQYNHNQFSKLWSVLIRDTGRFCENYASDILYSIDSISNIVNTLPENQTNYTIVGLRTNGVDNEKEVYDRYTSAINSLDGFYHKLYCVVITKTNNTVEYELVDITNTFTVNKE